MATEEECDDFNSRLTETNRCLTQLQTSFDRCIIDLKERQDDHHAEQMKIIQEHRDDTKGLIEAWNTANGLAKFVKWSAGLVAVFVAALVYFKGG